MDPAHPRRRHQRRLAAELPTPGRCKAAAIASAAMFLGACAFGEPYPARWEAVGQPRSDCRHLEGSYAERGERAGSQHPAYLSSLVFGSASPGASRISISLPRKDKVELAAWAQGDATPAGDSLVVRVEESIIGLAVVFPVVASQTRWYRFARARQ